MTNKPPHFTPEQKDFICEQIGEWYFAWKNEFQGQHRLGYAKEMLKTMICGQEINNSIYAKDKPTEHELMIEHICKMSHLLGTIHGKVANIVHDKENSNQLAIELWDFINSKVNKMFYDESGKGKETPWEK